MQILNEHVFYQTLCKARKLEETFQDKKYLRAGSRRCSQTLQYFLSRKMHILIQHDFFSQTKNRFLGFFNILGNENENIS